MRETRIGMGMPVTIEVVDGRVRRKNLDDIFAYFAYIDNTFSPFKGLSELSRINRGELNRSMWSADMKAIFYLAEETKRETGGYFDIKTPDGRYDPSGIVKGWAIWKAAGILRKKGFRNFYVDAGGDVEVSGTNERGGKWTIGIRNPFNVREIVKKVALTSGGIATSGNYERGNHIYNPKTGKAADSDVVSVSVVGPNVYEADRFATAAFAMGEVGIRFLEQLPGLEGYAIDRRGIATMTSGFPRYVIHV